MARRFTAAFALLALLCTVARAAESDATPKGAAEGFFRALEAGDVTKAKAFSVGEEKHMAMLDLLVPLVGNFKKMETAAVKKWGDAGKKMLSEGPGGAGGFDVEGQLKDAKVEEKGETATITPAKKEDGKSEPMKLRKVAGKWKVDMAAMPNAEGMDTPQAKKMLTGMGDIAKQMATEIEGGKYQTPEQAKEAFGQKMLPLFLGAAAEGAGGAQPAGAGGGQPPKKEDK